MVAKIEIDEVIMIGQKYRRGKNIASVRAPAVKDKDSGRGFFLGENEPAFEGNFIFRNYTEGLHLDVECAGSDVAGGFGDLKDKVG